MVFLFHLLVKQFQQSSVAATMLNLTATSSSLIQQPQALSRPPSHLTLTNSLGHYRVLAREYHKYHSTVYMWSLFWMVTNLTLVTLLITDFQHYNKDICLGMITLSGAVLCAYALSARQSLPKSAVFYSFNLMALAFFLLVLRLLGFRLLSFAMLHFGLIQVFVSIRFMGQTGRLICESLVAGVLLLVGMRLDGLIGWNWGVVLILVVFGCVLCLFALFFVILYAIILSSQYPASYTAKLHSILFLALTLGSIFTLLAIPTCWVVFDSGPAFLCIPAMAAASSNAAYLFIYSKDIVLFFCRHKESIQKSEQDKVVHLNPLNGPHKSLHRLSENWFGDEPNEEACQQDKISMPECLICTDSPSEVIWLPCGHLTVCSACCRQMISNNMHQCILCKQRPTHIARIQTKNSIEAEMDRSMGLNPESASVFDLAEHYQVVYE